MIGKILNGRYEIIEKIGSGGMAVVYKAKCRLLNRFVAIKVLRDELKSDRDFVERFNIEAKSAAALSHPNIVSVYDVGEQDDVHFIVMEYIEGPTLKEVIQSKGALDWRDAASIGIQICSAIDHAHRRNIIHRDIKPHNIMLTREGTVKVTDFGIARAVSSTTRVAGGNVIGSVHYFSPEQARGENVDAKSDIYSIGVVLYEMLTGRVPYVGDSPYEVARKHIEAIPESPSAAKSSVPRAMDGIVMRAMSKTPADRYASASLMMEDLKLAMNNPQADVASHDDMQSTILIPPVTNINEANSPAKADNKSKRRDVVAVVLAIVTAIAIMGAATYSVISLFGPNLNTSAEGQTVPDITGRLLDDVKQELKDKKITITEVGSEYSTKYDEGYIISQDPAPNTPLKLPAEIRVIVSKGRRTFQLGSYVHMDYREAERDIDSKSLVANTRFEKNSDIPKGVVISQSPRAGEMVRPGDVITLVVSDGPESNKIKVPNILGLSEESAKEVLRQNGLTVGEISEGRSSKPKGVVVYQEPLAKTEVDLGTPVSFTTSTGIPVSSGRGEAVPATPTPDAKPQETPKPQGSSTNLQPEQGAGQNTASTPAPIQASGQQ